MSVNGLLVKRGHGVVEPSRMAWVSLADRAAFDQSEDVIDVRLADVRVWPSSDNRDDK